MTIKTNSFYRGDIIAPLPTLLLYHKKDCYFRVGISFLHYSWCLDFMQDDPEPEVTVSPEEQERIRKMMEQTVKPVVTASVDSSRFEAAIKQAKFPSGGVVPKDHTCGSIWQVVDRETTANELLRKVREELPNTILHITDGESKKVLASIDVRGVRLHYITDNFNDDTQFIVSSVTTGYPIKGCYIYYIAAVGLGR